MEPLQIFMLFEGLQGGVVVLQSPQDGLEPLHYLFVFYRSGSLLIHLVILFEFVIDFLTLLVCFLLEVLKASIL